MSRSALAAHPFAGSKVDNFQKFGYIHTMVTTDHIEEAARLIRNGEYNMATSRNNKWFDLNGRWTALAVVADVAFDGWWEWCPIFEEWTPVDSDSVRMYLDCDLVGSYFDLIDEYCCSNSEKADMLEALPASALPKFVLEQPWQVHA